MPCVLHGLVSCTTHRTDFDLGPGLEIADPGFKLSVPLPKEGSVYDYVFDKGRCQWKLWLDTIKVKSCVCVCVCACVPVCIHVTPLNCCGCPLRLQSEYTTDQLVCWLHVSTRSSIGEQGIMCVCVRVCTHTGHRDPRGSALQRDHRPNNRHSPLRLPARSTHHTRQACAVCRHDGHRQDNLYQGHDRQGMEARPDTRVCACTLTCIQIHVYDYATGWTL